MAAILTGMKWYLIVVLIFISLTMCIFHVFVRCLYVFLGEMSVKFFGPVFDWLVYFTGNELHGLLVYFGDELFISCFICYCYYLIPF